MKRLDWLAEWLARQAAEPLAEVFDAFCSMLLERGLPLWRVVLGTETLHPEETGGQRIWIVDQTARLETFDHGVEATSTYVDSPLRIVDDTGRPFRVRLDADTPLMALLSELRQAGATDYYIHPLPFLDRSRSAFISYATVAPYGFSDEDIADLALAAELFSPWVERHALRRIAVDLLDTYLGRHAGERVFSGQVLRGQVEEIEAAIMMCDMRGFTDYSNQIGRQAVIDTVNAFFDAVAASVEAEGGEILKFMGDGLLAIFRAEKGAGEACGRALAAFRRSTAAVAAVNGARGAAGYDAIAFVTALHVGTVAYGNVGGRRRLDFTVLGSAVNYASRLESLAKELDRPCLASADFAAALKEPLPQLGTFSLRSFGDAQEVYTVSDGGLTPIRDG